MCERITAAAIRLNGTIYTGTAHFGALCRAYQHLTTDEVRRAAELEWSQVWDEGFVTSTDRFVSRDEATAIAKNAQQPMTRYTPEMNDGSHVFVFGSNLAGRHGRGAALDAAEHWGAQRGIGAGRTGMAYAIPTKDHSIVTLELWEIEPYVQEFLNYANSHPELIFLVTCVGCGLAGYDNKDMAPMFKYAPANCKLPEVWNDYL